MKLRDLVAELERAGCVLLRNGAKHDIYHARSTENQSLCHDIAR